MGEKFINYEDLLYGNDNGVELPNLLDEATDPKEKGIPNRLITTYEHMLKYKVQKNRQDSSWPRTLLRSQHDLNEIIRKATGNINKKISDEELDKAYSKARENAASITSIPIKNFPENRDPDWTIEAITNREWMVNYLYDEARNDDIKDIVDKLRKSKDSRGK